MSRSTCLIDYSEERDYYLTELTLLAEVFIHQYTILQYYTLKVNNVSTLYRKCLYAHLHCYIKLYNTIQKMGFVSFKLQHTKLQMKWSKTSPNLHQIASSLTKWHSQWTSIINSSKISINQKICVWVIKRSETPIMKFLIFHFNSPNNI